MLKEGIGFFTMTIGAMMGGSDNLVIPAIIILIGALLIFSNTDEM